MWKTFHGIHNVCLGKSVWILLDSFRKLEKPDSLTIKQDLEVSMNVAWWDLGSCFQAVICCLFPCTDCSVYVPSLFIKATPVYEECECVFQPIILVLLDIPPMLPVLDGVVMELQDCALPLLRGEPTVCVTVCLNQGKKYKINDIWRFEQLQGFWRLTVSQTNIQCFLHSFLSGGKTCGSHHETLQHHTHHYHLHKKVQATVAGML